MMNNINNSQKHTYKSNMNLEGEYPYSAKNLNSFHHSYTDEHRGDYLAAVYGAEDEETSQCPRLNNYSESMYPIYDERFGLIPNHSSQIDNPFNNNNIEDHHSNFLPLSIPPNMNYNLDSDMDFFKTSSFNGNDFEHSTQSNVPRPEKMAVIDVDQFFSKAPDPPPEPSPGVVDTEHQSIHDYSTEKFLPLLTNILNLIHCKFCPSASGTCDLPDCIIFKRLLQHIISCQSNPCSENTSCVVLRDVFSHFITCSKPDCSLCAEILNKCADSIKKIQSIESKVSLASETLFDRFYSHLLSKIFSSGLPFIEPNLPSTFPDSSNKCDLNQFPDTFQNVTEGQYDPQFIYDSFIPIISSMMSSNEAIYFLEAVDPVKLCIPDYPEIVRKPMDLKIVSEKLNNLQYFSPWDIIYDVNLTFDNAFLYNKKNTKVHKAASKLASSFEAFTGKFMRDLGYCCDKRYTYSMQVMYCNSKDFCVIPVNQHYYRCEEQKVFFCLNCYSKFTDDYVLCSKDDNLEPVRIPKSLFVQERNNRIVEEPFVVCVLCRKKFHKVCTMHVDVIDGFFFYCSTCIEKYNIKRPQMMFTSRNLPLTPLSEYIEKRVNNFLHLEQKDIKHVNIRMICNVRKDLETKQGLIRRFPHLLNSSYPYHLKAIFAFQEHDDFEVCFFSMHVQEFDEDCPEPNRRRVYLSYLDSVHYFQPKALKTALYYEIISSYLMYCKLNGYLYCHIWSCPPCEGDDYIFHCHSFEQKLPKPRRLLDWYNKFIEIAIKKGVVISCQDIFQYFSHHPNELVGSIPYFDGDYWSNSLEEIVVEYEKETSASTAQQKSEKDSKSKGQRKNVHKNKLSTPKKSGSNETLNNRIRSFMEKFREVFFVLKLNENETSFVKDPNPTFVSELMDGRSGFLTMSRDNNWEFSSFRHAIYSTKAVLFVVHLQMYNFSEFTCDYCNAVLSEGYHCDTCTNDFDLCSSCLSFATHQHPMSAKKYITFGSIHHEQSPIKNPPKLPVLDTILDPKTFKKTEVMFLHAAYCQGECPIDYCRTIRKFINHFNSCTAPNRNSCPACKHVFSVYSLHASNCKKDVCAFPSCPRLKGLNKHNRISNNQKIRSRINNMNHNASDFNANPSVVSQPKKETKVSTTTEKFDNKYTPIEKKSPVRDAIFNSAPGHSDTRPPRNHPSSRKDTSQNASQHHFSSSADGHESTSKPFVQKSIQMPQVLMTPQQQSLMHPPRLIGQQNILHHPSQQSTLAPSRRGNCSSRQDLTPRQVIDQNMLNQPGRVIMYGSVPTNPNISSINPASQQNILLNRNQVFLGQPPQNEMNQNTNQTVNVNINVPTNVVPNSQVKVGTDNLSIHNGTHPTRLIGNAQAFNPNIPPIYYPVVPFNGPGGPSGYILANSQHGPVPVKFLSANTLNPNNTGMQTFVQNNRISSTPNIRQVNINADSYNRNLSTPNVSIIPVKDEFGNAPGNGQQLEQYLQNPSAQVHFTPNQQIIQSKYGPNGYGFVPSMYAVGGMSGDNGNGTVHVQSHQNTPGTNTQPQQAIIQGINPNGMIFTQNNRPPGVVVNQMGQIIGSQWSNNAPVSYVDRNTNQMFIANPTFLNPPNQLQINMMNQMNAQVLNVPQNPQQNTKEGTRPDIYRGSR